MTKSKSYTQILKFSILTILVFLGLPNPGYHAEPAKLFIGGDIFSDGFESGNTSRWDAVTGDVSARLGAAQSGLYGARVRITNQNPSYLQDNSPQADLRYSASFILDINTLQMSEGGKINLFQAGTGKNKSFMIQLRKFENQYWIRASARLDHGKWRRLGWAPLPDQPTTVKVLWKRASQPKIHNGKIKLFLNGKIAAKRGRLNNDTFQVDRVRLGVTRKIHSSFTISGKFFIDEFVSKNPDPFDPPTVIFAAIGDYGLDSNDEAKVAALVDSWNPNFVITLGDNNYQYGKAKTIDENIGQYYQQYIYPYNGSYGPGATSNRFFPSLGNHDWLSTNAEPYTDYFTLPGNERYYTFTRGEVQFFVIDSDPHEPDGITQSSVQALWLKKKLKNSTKPWKIVYFHHTAYTSGIRPPSLDMRWPFKEWGASVVLSGHDHFYERLIANDIPYFINGLGGKTKYSFGDIFSGSLFRYNSKFGALKIEAAANHLTLKFINVDEEVIDSYTLIHP